MTVPLVILTYGIVFFLFLNFYYDIPKSLRKIQQFTYTFLEYCVFAIILFHNARGKLLQRFILFGSIFFFIFQVITYITSTNQVIDSIPVGIETILIFIYAFFYFYDYMKIIGSNIFNNPSVFLVFGILLYLGSTFFFNILANKLSSEQSDRYWHFTYIPEIIKNILFFIAILKYTHASVASVKSSKNNKPKSPYLDMVS
jgi:hypothetical protein